MWLSQIVQAIHKAKSEALGLWPLATVGTQEFASSDGFLRNIL